MKKIIFLLPIAFFLTLAVLFSMRLGQEEAPVARHPLLGKKLPAFSLQPLEEGNPPLESSEFKGPAVVNVFASWCVPCKVEQPVLMELADTHGLVIYGVNWKDSPQDAKVWLQEQGNPYKAVGMDMDGKAALALGITGVPESFILDKEGILVGHIAGPLGKTQFDLLSLPSSAGD